MSELTLQLKRKLNVNSLAADLVLYGADDLVGVMRAHGLDDLDLTEQLEGNVALRARIKALKLQIEKDPRAMIRLKAASAVEGHVSTLNLAVADGTADLKDRLAAMRLLSELADALPRADPAAAKGHSGITLNLNLGHLGTPSTVRPVNIIDVESHHAPDL